MTPVKNVPFKNFGKSAYGSGVKLSESFTFIRPVYLTIQPNTAEPTDLDNTGTRVWGRCTVGSRGFDPEVCAAQNKVPFVNGIIIALLIFSITLGYLSPLIPERSEVSAQGDVGALNILKPGQVEAAGVRETEETLRQAQGEQKLPPELSQDFSWGVLAINFDQSIYLPGQETKIAFSVLDEKGVADCNAILALEIKDPQGAMTSLSAKDKTIQKSQSCGTLEATNEPDYFATYTPSTIGVYEAKFTAARSNDPVSLGKSRTIVDHFYVEEKPEVIVRREGPTRLYPANRYTMEFEIESLNDFSGQIKESVPLSFDVIHRDGMEIFQENGAKTLSWQNDLIKGVNYKFSYEFQGPEESPQFYLAGPLKLEADSSVIPHSMRDPELEAGTLDSRLRGNDNGSGNDNEESVVSGQSSNVAFQEARAWQLANDAQYNCTWNTGSGTWETAGNWSNCNGTYPANGADTYTATIDNASAVVTTGATAVTIDSLTVGGTNTSSLTLSFKFTIYFTITTTAIKIVMASIHFTMVSTRSKTSSSYILFL